MSRKAWSVLGNPSGSGRFAYAILGACVVGLAWLVTATSMSISPEQARERRASPILPPPSAPLVRTELRQVSWYPCSRTATTVDVVAPEVPAGYRSIVTWLAPRGIKARTGTLLAKVSGQPLFAIETSDALYRDLVVGLRGADVRAFETALKRAGFIARVDDLLEPATVAAWRRHADHAGRGDRIKINSLVSVPRNTILDNLASSKSKEVKRGDVLMTLTSGVGAYRCEVPDIPKDVVPGRLTFQVDGAILKDAVFVLHQREEDKPGYAEVRLKKSVTAEEGQLGITAASSKGSVLAAPLSAIKTDSSGEFGVVVIDGANQRQVPVGLGVSAEGLIEVKGEGLDEGVRVLLFDGTNMQQPDPASPTSMPTAVPSNSATVR